jgi:hypothetical protein
MNVRTTILLAAGALLASRAGAQGAASEPQRQPPEQSQPRQQSTAEKARELGDKGADAAKRGARSAGKTLNEGGQAATAKVVGTKTVTGRIAGVSHDQLTVKAGDGTPMDLRLTDSTKVTIGGQKASVGALKQGDEVRASYAQSGGSATAMKIEARRMKSPAAGGGPGRSASPGSPSDPGSGAAPK